MKKCNKCKNDKPQYSIPCKHCRKDTGKYGYKFEIGRCDECIKNNVTVIWDYLGRPQIKHPTSVVMVKCT